MVKARNVFIVILRVLAIAATLSATIVMATSHETTTFFSITLEAKFQHTPAFKFLVIVNAIIGAYSLMALLVPPTSSLWRLIVALDVLAAMLLTASLSAAASVSYVGKKGNAHAGWLPICGQTPKFCDQVMGALICAFVGVLAYTFLVLYTIHNVLNPLLI